jgi:hypothetical protein
MTAKGQQIQHCNDVQKKTEYRELCLEGRIEYVHHAKARLHIHDLPAQLHRRKN